MGYEIPLVVYAGDCQPTGDNRTLIFDAKQTLTKLNFKSKWECSQDRRKVSSE